jgi:hypothetical protein
MNDCRMLQYNRLVAKMFTDTLEAGTLSRRQNKYAQAYVIPPNWAKAYSMRKKNDAHHKVSNLFHDIGVPETLVMDGSKEQTMVNSARSVVMQVLMSIRRNHIPHGRIVPN